MAKSRLFTAIVLFTISVGCSSPAPPDPGGSASTKVDYAAELAATQESLRKSITDVGQVRQSLEQLNAILANTDQQPKPLVAEALARLKATHRLTDDEAAELNRPAFSALDAQYVMECIIFRDIARALRLTGDANAIAAAAAQWVVAHVRYDDRPGSADPPIFVLNRGSGTGVERMYVFAALVKQLGLSVTLFGDTDASANIDHLWAVAVNDAESTVILDPRVGITIGSWPKNSTNDPGAIARQLAGWEGTGFDITPERFDAHAKYSPCALSSLSPRMQVLEELIGKIRLYDDGTRAIMTTPWAAGVAGTPLRVLAEALPPEDGGTDRNPPGKRRIDRIQSEMVRWSVVPKELLQVPGEIGLRLQQVFGETALLTAKPGLPQTIKEQQQFAESLRGTTREISDAKLRAEVQLNAEQQFRPSFREDDGPTLRQLVMLGHYEEATTALVTLSEGLRTVRGRPEGANSQGAALEWAAKIGPAYSEFLRARRSQDSKAITQARLTMEALLRESQPAETFIRWLAAGQALSDVTYLTALCKLDQAEAHWRKWAESESTKASARTAQQTWDQYAGEYPDSPRLGHALRMRARAQYLGGKYQAAAESYRKAAGKLGGIERPACLILARELEKR